MAEKYYPVMKTLRLTKEDAVHLKERAEDAGMKEAEYIRYVLRMKPNSYPEIRQLLKTLINEVNHIGVNINQIAKNSNAGYFSSTDKQQLIAYMQKLNMEVERVVKALGNQ